MKNNLLSILRIQYQLHLSLLKTINLNQFQLAAVQVMHRLLRSRSIFAVKRSARMAVDQEIGYTLSSVSMVSH